MRLTKLGHSCVLVEEEGKSVLFDPGGWAERSLIDAVEHVDCVIYTHEHGDHFDVEILRSLVAKFPDLQVVCNGEIQQQIRDASVEVSTVEETETIKKFEAPHEALPIPGAQAPAENGYHFLDAYSHPGDSQHFSETKRVLAMPFIGQWGKTGDSIAKVLELKPEYVLPVHDWHYTAEAKEWLQGVLEFALKDSGITLLPNENGKIIEQE